MCFQTTRAAPHLQQCEVQRLTAAAQRVLPAPLRQLLPVIELLRAVPPLPQLLVTQRQPAPNQRGNDRLEPGRGAAVRCATAAAAVAATAAVAERVGVGAAAPAVLLLPFQKSATAACTLLTACNMKIHTDHDVDDLLRLGRLRSPRSQTVRTRLGQ